MTYGYAGLLGALAALGFAPLFWWPLTLVSFTLMWRHYIRLVASSPRPLRAATLFGWCFGFGHFVVGLYWISNALTVDLAAFWWLFPFSLFGLPAVLALFTAIPFALTVFRPNILLFATLWVAAEWIRGHAFTGFPWNLMGYIWGGIPSLCQVASLVGIYGLSLLTVFAGLSLTSRRAFCVSALIVALSWGWGYHRITHPSVLPATPFGIRLVQPNIPQNLKWDPAEKTSNFHKVLRLTTLPSSLTLKAIIWPESAVPFFLDQEPEYRQLIADSLPRGALLFTGGLRRTDPTRQGLQIWNSLLVLDEHANLVASCDKSHLVPFGEYLPWRNLLDAMCGKHALKKITAGTVDFTPGYGPQSIPLPQGFPAFSGLVCYEVIFPGAIVHPTQPRPGWVINVTNDAWYGNSSGPYQHLETARFRAIEEGIPVVRAANSGISAVFDAYGQSVASLPLNTEGVLDLELPSPLASPPLYAQWGDYTLWVLLLGLGLCGFFLSPRRLPQQG